MPLLCYSFNMKSSQALIEITLIFILPPLLIMSGVLPRLAIMPVLWFFFFYALWYLNRVRFPIFVIDFDRHDLWLVLRRFFLIALAMIVFLLLNSPESFLQMPRQRPWFWLGLMLLYPVLSAFTQEVLFRTYYYERYKAFHEQMPSVMVMGNIVLFAYVHLVFENPLAVAFTLIGGILFNHTYLKTGSTLLVSIEHGLYGNALYTIGFGHYFYHNGTPLLQ